MDSKHLELLNRGVESWNAWRSRTTEQPDLSHASITNFDLRGIDLRDVNLTGATFHKGLLHGADLSGASAEGLSMEKVSAAELNITRLMAPHLSLNSVQLPGIRFEDSKLTGLQTRDLIAPDARFINTDLSGSVFSDSDLENSVFLNSELHDATMVEANLRKVRFERINAIRLKIEHCNAIGSTWSNNKLSYGTFNYVYLHGSQWWGEAPINYGESCLMLSRPKEMQVWTNHLSHLQLVNVLLTNPKLLDDVPRLRSSIVLLVGVWPMTRLYIPQLVSSMIVRQGTLVVSVNLFESEYNPYLDTLIKLTSHAVIDETRQTPGLYHLSKLLQDHGIKPQVISEAGAKARNAVVKIDNDPLNLTSVYIGRNYQVEFLNEFKLQMAN